mmetsp:Transcript_62838/g.199029  ORF Transcript_62838/g.199029 Transcript_62838/m.199029 type:complete len:195 (-) Transcript_62838:261-845(-)
MAQTSAEVEETFKRINSHKGVLGAIVVNYDGIAIRTTMDNAVTVRVRGPSPQCPPLPPTTSAWRVGGAGALPTDPSPALHSVGYGCPRGSASARFLCPMRPARGEHRTSGSRELWFCPRAVTELCGGRARRLGIACLARALLSATRRREERSADVMLTCADNAMLTCADMSVPAAARGPDHGDDDEGQVDREDP